MGHWILYTSENVLDNKKGMYQNALVKAGYVFQMHWLPDRGAWIGSNNQMKTRRKQIVWYNPPWSRQILTPIDRNFISLIRKWFSNNLSM